ncbi:MAG: SMP-30/gluconolactonase/LRE family protein, partial [Candidatus Thiodiazotropha sp.]
MSTKNYFSNLPCLFILLLNLPFALESALADPNGENRDISIDTLVEGAALPSTNGIYFNARDELFVTSVVGRSITQIHPLTGQIISILGPEQGVETPDDLVFDSLGNLYWTAFLTGEIGCLTPMGEKSTIANLGPGVNAITLSTDERKLYVSRIFLADEVWEIDLSGIEPPRLLAQDLGGFNGMDIGPDGKLYGPLWYHGQIASIDTDTGAVEIVADSLSTPSAVKFSHAGELFVVDPAIGWALRIDTDSGEREFVADVGVGADNLAFDSQDRLYVTNTQDSAVRIVSGTSYRSDLKHDYAEHLSIETWRGAEYHQHDFDATTRRVVKITRGGLSTSSGIALHNSGDRDSLFVADIYSLRNYSPRSGHPRFIAHCIVGGITGLNTPFSLSSHGSHLVVTSWFGNLVQIWSPELQEVVDEYRDFAVPLNAISYGDGLAVAELGSGCVMQQPSGRSDRSSLACGFKVPAGLAQLNGTLFVSDWATGSVWQIGHDYKSLEPPLLISSGLLQPEGMALTEEGTLLVVETGAGRILELDPST